MEPLHSGRHASSLVRDGDLNDREIRALLASPAAQAADLSALDVVLPGLALMIEARDPYTQGHCERLAEYGMALGEAWGLGHEDIDSLRRGGFLHDLGKIGIPDAILLKPGRLTDDEYELMKTHTIIGERLFGTLPSFAPVRAIVRHHHERLDGSGYPDGLRGDDIPVLAQIVSVVDAFDAMTITRPYRSSLTVQAACEELAREARQGTMNRELVRAFMSVIHRHEHRVTHLIEMGHTAPVDRLDRGAA
jgi:putative two-component system response regulator